MYRSRPNSALSTETTKTLSLFINIVLIASFLLNWVKPTILSYYQTTTALSLYTFFIYVLTPLDFVILPLFSVLLFILCLFHLFKYTYVLLNPHMPNEYYLIVGHNTLLLCQFTWFIFIYLIVLLNIKWNLASTGPIECVILPSLPSYLFLFLTLIARGVLRKVEQNKWYLQQQKDLSKFACPKCNYYYDGSMNSCPHCGYPHPNTPS